MRDHYIKSTVQYVGGIKDHYLDFEGKSSYTEIDDLLEIMEMPYKFFENSFWLKGMFESAMKKDIGVLLNGDRGNLDYILGICSRILCYSIKKIKMDSTFSMN